MGQGEQLNNKTKEFRTENDKIKGIVGEIGGKSSAQHKIVNLIFAILIVVLLVLGVALQKITMPITLQVVALLALFKILWMFYEVQRSIHFQFWLLNSLEFRINDVDKRMKKIEKLLKEEKNQESTQEKPPVQSENPQSEDKATGKKEAE